MHGWDAGIRQDFCQQDTTPGDVQQVGYTGLYSTSFILTSGSGTKKIQYLCEGNENTSVRRLRILKHPASLLCTYKGHFTHLHVYAYFLKASEFHAHLTFNFLVSSLSPSRH